MATNELIQKLVEICYLKGIRNAVLCPGSRSAALTIAFEQHPEINCLSISDERSAGFIALGMAQISKQPTVLVCTSGTAALNFSPAVAEAYFQEIPLLVLTADRPQEWIHQYDGQTIFQDNIYGKNCKKSFQLLADFENVEVAWFAQRVINEAIDSSKAFPIGPVHINIPIREPFYPKNTTKRPEQSDLYFVKSTSTKKIIDLEEWNQLTTTWENTKTIWIAVGQQDSTELKDILNQIASDKRVVVIGDLISNVDSSIKCHDLFFKHFSDNSFPDLLITCGKSFISKNLKLYLRKNRGKIKNHWHVQDNDRIIDPFMSISRKIEIHETTFFNELELRIAKKVNQKVNSALLKFETKSRKILNDSIQRIAYSDLTCVFEILKRIPENSIIQAGNSLSVRYINILGYFLKKNIRVYCNRGTSGIEGTLSTAVGQALSTTEVVYCILGDVSFQYDKNALWNNYLPTNLKIIILNNQGGNIFRMIDGPKLQTSYKTFFETEQLNTAEWIAKEFNLSYFFVKESDSSPMDQFINENKFPSILEFFTEPQINEKALKTLFTEVEQGLKNLITDHE